MTKGECPIEEHYFIRKVYKCPLASMCNKEHKCDCKINPYLKRGKNKKDEGVNC